MANKVDRFGKGRPAYRCIECNKLTRDTGQDEYQSRMCAHCYEICLLDNSLADGDITEDEYNAKLEELGKKYKKVRGS